MSFSDAWDAIKSTLAAAPPGPSLTELSPKLMDMAEAGKLEVAGRYGLFLLRGPEPAREVHITIRAWQIWVEVQIGAVGTNMDRNLAYKELAPLMQTVTQDLITLRSGTIKAGFLAASAPVQALGDNRWVAPMQFRFIYTP